MIYKYTKCESVIAKIMADLDMTEKNQRITDIREWIFEAIDKIGAPMQYIQKESGVDGAPLLKIEDHQVPIPADLYQLDAVAYSSTPTGRWVPVDKSTSIFHDLHHKKQEKKHGFVNMTPEHNDANKAIEEQIIEIGEKHQDPAFKLPTSQSQLYNGLSLQLTGNTYFDRYDEDVKYFLKPGWLVVNKDKGYIKLSYKALAVDQRGYPLIPDLSSYQEAVYWYVVMKLNFPKFLNGKLGGKGVNSAAQTYNYLQNQWHFYRNQAYAEAMMPTADDMKNIKNDWNKLIPEWDSDETFFKHQGEPQMAYNDYYYGY